MRTRPAGFSSTPATRLVKMWSLSSGSSGLLKPAVWTYSAVVFSLGAGACSSAGVGAARDTLPPAAPVVFFGGTKRGLAVYSGGSRWFTFVFTVTARLCLAPLEGRTPPNEILV